MFSSIGPLEIGIIALVVILLFGVGKLSGLGRDLGSSVKEFRRAIKDEDKEKAEAAAATQIQQAPPVQQNGYQQPPQQYVPPPQQYAPPPQQPQYQQPAPPPQQPPMAPQDDKTKVF
jgi:sec-independent protein translocase protein TatA